MLVPAVFLALMMMTTRGQKGDARVNVMVCVCVCVVACVAAARNALVRARASIVSIRRVCMRCRTGWGGIRVCVRVCVFA